MANGCDGLFGRKEFTNNFQNARIETNILRSASACDEKTFVVLCFDCVKIRSQGKVVATKFGIGLLAEEIMDGCSNSFACLFVRADRIHLISQDAKRLEGYHCLIIFSKITA